MDVLQAIHTRRSIRQYEQRPVPGELVEELLRAAMMAPSACNVQPWHFVVIDDRRTLDAIPVFAPHASMVAAAPLAILLCADLSIEVSPGYGLIDCSAATEKVLLAAHGLGLGAVWCGVYPLTERMEGFRRLLRLPENVMPHSLVVVGYPAEQPPSEDRYRPERVHRNAW
jgi:nitroreductase